MREREEVWGRHWSYAKWSPLSINFDSFRPSSKVNNPYISGSILRPTASECDNVYCLLAIGKPQSDSMNPRMRKKIFFLSLLASFCGLALRDFKLTYYSRTSTNGHLCITVIHHLIWPPYNGFLTTTATATKVRPNCQSNLSTTVS